jgi:predicted phage gp36 major capsid-like protein
MSEDYTQKYLKYKNKYLKLKAEYLNRNKQYGGDGDDLNQLTATPTKSEINGYKLNTLYMETNDINRLKLLGGNENNNIRTESTVLSESTNVSQSTDEASTESSDSPDSTESTNTSSTVDSSPIKSELNETLTLSSLSSLKTDV